MYRSLYVGRTSRSNAEGVDRLAHLLEPLGYTVRGVAVRGCLHLKSAVSWLGDNTVLLNPDWVDESLFEGMRIIQVHPDEPHAGNALRIGSTLLCAAAHRRTHERMEKAGCPVRVVDITELARAEAGMTCSSLVLEQAD
jgi:dimethylargininase